MTDRTTRLAELLLAEKNIIELHTKTNFELNFSLPRLYENFTPIEKVMYAIVDRVRLNLDGCLDDFGIIPQAKIGKYIVDFLLTSPEKKSVIIECDGHDFHEKTKEQAKHDKERDRYFTKNGFKVLHYTGSEIYNNFPDIEEEIQDFISLEWGVYE